MVHGGGYERVAVPGCSDRTIRRRLADWAERGVTKDLLRTSLTGYERMLGLDLEDLAVDGSITKSLGAGEVSGRSPVGRGRQGTKRSVVTDAFGSRCLWSLKRPTLTIRPCWNRPWLASGPLPEGAAVHLDAGYDSGKTRDLLAILGYSPHIATKGKPAPIQAIKRWPVERTHSWMNGYGRLRRFTDKTRTVVEFYLFLAAAITVIRRLITTARHHYRWETRPTTRRLR